MSGIHGCATMSYRAPLRVSSSSRIASGIARFSSAARVASTSPRCSTSAACTVCPIRSAGPDCSWNARLAGLRGRWAECGAVSGAGPVDCVLGCAPAGCAAAGCVPTGCVPVAVAGRQSDGSRCWAKPATRCVAGAPHSTHASGATRDSTSSPASSPASLSLSSPASSSSSEGGASGAYRWGTWRPARPADTRTWRGSRPTGRGRPPTRRPCWGSRRALGPPGPWRAWPAPAARAGRPAAGVRPAGRRPRAARRWRRSHSPERSLRGGRNVMGPVGVMGVRCR